MLAWSSLELGFCLALFLGPLFFPSAAQVWKGVPNVRRRAQVIEHQVTTRFFISITEEKQSAAYKYTGNVTKDTPTQNVRCSIYVLFGCCGRVVPLVRSVRGYPFAWFTLLNIKHPSGRFLTQFVEKPLQRKF